MEWRDFYFTNVIQFLYTTLLYAKNDMVIYH